MEIKNYEVEKIKDPTNIIVGDRYEFILGVEVDEEDELYTEGGLELRLIVAVDDKGERIVQHHFTNALTQEILEFAMDEDEEEEVLTFCKEHISEANLL